LGLFVTERMDGVLEPLMIPYGGVQVTAQEIDNLTKSIGRLKQGRCSYLISGADDVVDVKGNPVPQVYFDGHPDLWTGLPEHNPWIGTFVNEPPHGTMANMTLVDATGILHPPLHRNIDSNNMSAWALEVEVWPGDELFGYYNWKHKVRSTSRLEYASTQAVPYTPTLSRAREATKQEVAQERRRNKDTRYRIRMEQLKHDQAMHASKTRQKRMAEEEERNNSKGAKMREGKKSRYDEDDWEGGDRDMPDYER
jgi:hypothetical protein